MKIEEHRKALQEHRTNLNQAIDQGIEENQRNIGFNVSQASVELFAIYLHTLHLIEGSGDQWDHRLFKNKRMIELKVPPAFPARERILPLMEKIERDRLLLCYGKRKAKVKIEEIILAFRQLEEIISQQMPHEQK